MPYVKMLMENTTFSYDNPNKYNAKEYDMATGYYYYGARYYDPKRSFWISVDPLSEITNSPYAYVWNDPVNFADPSGMMGEKVGGRPKDWYRDSFGNISWHDSHADKIVGKNGETLTRLGKSYLYTNNKGGITSLNDDKTVTQGGQKSFMIMPTPMSWDSMYKNNPWGPTISSPSPSRGRSHFDYVMVDSNPLMKEIAKRVCVPCGNAADAIELAVDIQTSVSGNKNSKVSSSEKKVLSLNAAAGGGANILNIPLSQREQIQRAANKWNVEITVIGSRARGTANVGSDWDYIVNEIKPGMLHDMRFRLPKSALSRGELGRARLEIWKGTVKKNEAHITFKPSQLFIPLKN
ncbi:RHS repeat-associated core domain-containing protein [Chryseobacterium sp.]|uniref:RHS repeat-associated core domain-containing protein n=1 Tax=Chryseobacterium sp. TaxID=1871047 RepID=UPI002FC58A37